MMRLSVVPLPALVEEIIQRTGSHEAAAALFKKPVGRPPEDDAELLDEMYRLIEIERSVRTPHAAAHKLALKVPEHQRQALIARLQRKYREAAENVGPRVTLVANAAIQLECGGFLEKGDPFLVRHGQLWRYRGPMPAARPFDPQKDAALGEPVDLTK